MDLTKKQKAIKDRREFVYNAYNTKPPEMAVSVLVKGLASKYKVTEVLIYNDIAECKAPGSTKRVKKVA